MNFDIIVIFLMYVFTRGKAKNVIYNTCKFYIPSITDDSVILHYLVGTKLIKLVI